MIRRLLKRRQGITSLQAVLVLGLAFLVLIGLRQIWASSGDPKVREALARSFGEGGSASGSGRSDSSPESGDRTMRPITPGQAAEEARREIEKRREQIQEMNDFAYIAYDPSSNPAERDRYNRILAELQKKYDIQFGSDPASGLRYVIGLEKIRTPESKAVIAFAGSNEWKDWQANGGQLLGPDAANAVQYVRDNPTGFGWLDRAREAVAREKQTWFELNKAQNDGAKKVAEFVGAYYRPENVWVYGDSRGGGVGTLVSMLKGFNGMFTSAAPLGPMEMEEIRRNGVPGAELRITVIRAEDEAARLISNGTTVGNVITTEGRSKIPGWSIIANHNPDNIDYDKPIRYDPARRIDR
jgi:hypothetical protein